MTKVTIPRDERRQANWIKPACWLVLAFTLCLAVWPINGSPLFYVDTGGYLAQGDAILRGLAGLLERLLPGDNGHQTATQIEARDGIVVGSRSATYALFLSSAEAVLGIGAAAIGQTLLFVFVVWLAVRVSARALSGNEKHETRASSKRFPVSRVVAMVVTAGCLGALPFYTIYIMPDIFTSMLILIVATLSIFGQSMRHWEMAAALLIGAAAVTAHPSNLLIGGLLLGGAAIVALAVGTRRLWIGVALIAVILVVGLGERTLFTTAAKAIQKAEVVYNPFLTVRAIVDGPGLDRLAEVCPTTRLATCVLYERLKDHPERIHASNMMFSRAPENGSFALLDPEIQKKIAQEQTAFFAEVVKTHPVGMALAVLDNTIAQIGYVSIVMTMPIEDTLNRLATMTDNVPDVLWKARLTETPDWLPLLDRLHRGVYWITGLIVAILLLWPRRGLPLPLRGFALIVFGGIVANALVCGGISQPAERYGARVIFLVPMMAAMLIAFLPGFYGSRLPEERTGPTARSEKGG